MCNIYSKRVATELHFSNPSPFLMHKKCGTRTDMTYGLYFLIYSPIPDV